MTSQRWKSAFLLKYACLLTVAGLYPDRARADFSPEQLANLSLEQLASIEVSSASRKNERLIDTAASVYVITADAIHRSGATTLAEALRLAPNLQVARIDAQTYAISARGSNSSTSNKLQVLIDGRIAYTPLYSGVFWDSADVMLEDVERIEVISGSNATLWGSNAVNGIINVITRSAADTQGGLLVAGTGDEQRGGALRYGGTVNDGYYRVYGKWNDQSQTRSEAGRYEGDDWRSGRAGFRYDKDTLTLQGNAYEARLDRGTLQDGHIRGINLLSRWQKPLEDDAQLQLQAYYDRRERDLPDLLRETLDIVDIELQHNLPLGERHALIWGLSQRMAWDSVDNGLTLKFYPTDRYLHWSSLFAQDEIQLADDWQLTLGARLEQNTYTGWELMPSAKLAWKLTDDALLWTSLARGVRTPSRLDRDLYFNGLLNGGPNFVSETVDTLELGYRAQLTAKASYSVTLFYSDYDDLRTVELKNGSYEISNGMEGTTKGIEAWAEFEIAPHWQLMTGGTLMDEDLQLKSGRTDVSGNSGISDPNWQWQIRLSGDITPQVGLNLSLQHTDSLAATEVPSYTSLDMNLTYQPVPAVVLSLKANNLLNAEHSEFGSPGTRSEYNRSLYLKAEYRF